MREMEPSTSVTSPILGGGFVAAVDQLIAAPQNQDWTADFLTAVRPDGFGTSETAVGGSQLNTPTVELASDPFFKKIDSKSDHNSLLMEMDLDVVPGPSHQLDCQDFEAIWTIGNSPSSSDIYNAVPPFLVMGPTETDEGFESQSPLLTEEVVEVKEEEGTDLLDWLVTDTITADSAMPGEDAVEGPASTVDVSQLFTDYEPAAPTSVNRVNRGIIHEPRLLSPPPPSRKRSRLSSDSSSAFPPAKRGRGRPPLPPGRHITPPVKEILSSESELDYATDGGSLSDAAIKELKYRRMRDLNNEASKRCRENRKLKQEIAEAELQTLRVKNLELRSRLRELEAKVRRVKAFYQEHMVKGAAGNVPDLNLLWSTMDLEPNQF